MEQLTVKQVKIIIRLCIERSNYLTRTRKEFNTGDEQVKNIDEEINTLECAKEILRIAIENSPVIL